MTGRDWRETEPAPPRYPMRIDNMHHHLLTFTAPGKFRCDFCNASHNPITWSYSCKACDLYVCPGCIPKVFDDRMHEHPLSEMSKVSAGFHCALCNRFYRSGGEVRVCSQCAGFAICGFCCRGRPAQVRVGAIVGDGSGPCGICHRELAGPHPLLKLQCGCMFHDTCAVDWFRAAQMKVCPICAEGRLKVIT